MGYVFGKDCCDLGDDGEGEGTSTWDSITNYFSPPAPAPSFNEGQGPLVSAGNAPVAVDLPPDPNEMYSKYYTLADLCKTSLPHPNLPLDKLSQDNLRRLGALLDAIKERVGDYTIASAYRSPENQTALTQGAGGAAAKSMAVKKGYHPLGIAADLTPKNGMTPTQFAQKIYQDPFFTGQIGQIVDKSEGGNETSLHISIPTPLFPNPTPMYVINGAYYRMTPTQIGDWLSSKMTDTEEAIDLNQMISDDAFESDYQDSALEASPMSMKTVGFAIAAILAIYLLSTSKKKGLSPA